ncbi:plastocyanin/azurin family copper-binding protein [Streptomyces sp. NPDC047085]|uniref:plastocyanin/azurin family copper-binding protein n=1 Tax=Streptomyces sp. NPDC047085 TaxID=3155140 RepID=UPI0033D1B495
MTVSAHTTHTTRTTLCTAAVAFSAALLLAACSGGGGGQPHGSAGSGTATAGSGTRVTVTETDYALKLSRSSFTPGTYTFVADNAGKVMHALSIDGPGVEDAKTKNVQSGQQATVTVTLKKGTYDVYCPVDNHKQLGMDQHIKVG